MDLEAEVNRLTNIRASTKCAKEGTPGPEGSVGKLALARLLNQRMMADFAAMDLMGAPRRSTLP